LVGETVFVTVTVLENVGVTVVVTVTVFETEDTTAPETEPLVEVPAPAVTVKLTEVPNPAVREIEDERAAPVTERLRDPTIEGVIDSDKETVSAHILMTRLFPLSAITTVAPVEAEPP